MCVCAFPSEGLWKNRWDIDIGCEHSVVRLLPTFLFEQYYLSTVLFVKQRLRLRKIRC